MGATTLYHPISLHVIRGAAEYCGWKFGKIKQVTADKAKRLAIYHCTIERMPRAAAGWPIEIIRRQLQHCFMDDITVKKVWVTNHDVCYALLSVDINVTDDQGVQVMSQ